MATLKQLLNQHPSKKAGFIPYIFEDGKLLMMFMTPSDPNFGGDRPSIAKGNIDEGENELEAALREAHEELGLREKNLIDSTIQLMWKNMATGMQGDYSFSIFAGEVKNRVNFATPHYETKCVSWLTIEDFISEGRPGQVAIVEEVNKKILQSNK